MPPRIVSCRVPVDVAVTGRLTERQLRELEQGVTAAVLDQLAEVRRQLAARGYENAPRDVLPPFVTVTGEVPDAERRNLDATLVRAINAATAESGIGARARPLARRGGAPRSRRTVRVRSGPPLRIVSRGTAVTTIGGFTEYFAEFGEGAGGSLELLRALYADRTDQMLTVLTRRVAINRPMPLDAVVEWLSGRATAATPEGTVAFWVYTTRHEAPLRLAEIAEETEGDFELMTHHFGSVGTLPDGTDFVLPGAEVFFAYAYLPRITAQDVMELVSPSALTVNLPIRELGFLADQESFGRLLGVPWDDYVREFGDQISQLFILPFETLSFVHYRVVNYFLHDYIARQISSETAYFARTRILSDSAIAELPAQARSVAAAQSNPASRAATEADQFGVYEAGWRGAFIYAVFELTEEQQARALHRPEALRIAGELADLIRNARPRSIEWIAEMLRAFAGPFCSASNATQVAQFDMALDELDRLGLLEGLFEAIERARYYTLHERLVRFTSAGRYADHPLAVQTRGILNQRATTFREHDYDPERNVLFLEKNHQAMVPAGGDVGDVSGRYIFEAEDFELPPALQSRFEARALQKAEELAAAILAGRDTTAYTSESFTRQALVRAAEELDITDEDFVKRIKQISARFHGVERVVEGGVERYYVTWSLVERYRGSRTWNEVEGTRRRELVGYFEETLALWRIIQGFEGLQILAAAVGIGTVAIVGLVFLPELIALGGGLKLVLASIAISELIYFGRLIFTDETFSFEGFALAALDGYLFAVGFRFGALVAEGVGLRVLSSATTQTLGRARVVTLMTRGAVGGGTTGFLVRFSHDIYEIGVGRRSDFSSLGEYALHIGLGTVLGVVGELAVNAVMTRVLAAFAAAGRPGSATAIELSAVARRLSEEGVTFSRFVAESQVALTILRDRLAGVLDDAIAGSLRSRFREVIAQVRREYPAALRSQRFIQGLDLINLRLGPEGISGLERFIRVVGTEFDDAAALALVRGLRSAGEGRAHQFFNALGAVDEVTLSGLARAGQLRPFLDSEFALGFAADAPQLLSRLLRSRFRHQVREFDAFIRELSDLTVDRALRQRVMMVLLDQPRLPIDAVMTTVARLGALTDDAVNGLLSLFRVDRTAAELTALLRATSARSLPRLLGLSRALGPADMAALMERGVALQFARSPGAARMLEMSGWPATAQILEQRFGNTMAGLQTFADRLQASGLDDTAFRRVMTALTDNGAYSNESLVLVAEGLGDVTPAHAAALGELFELTHLGLARNAIDGLISRQAAHSAEALEGLLTLPGVLRADLPEVAQLGALEPLARNSGVVLNIRAPRIRQMRFLPLLRTRADGFTPDPVRVIEALERLLRSHPGTRLLAFRENLVTAQRLPQSLAEQAAGTRRLLPTGEALEVLGDIATGARLGTDRFRFGATVGTGTVEAVEVATRLIADNVDPRVARTAIDITTPNVSDLAAPPGAASVEFSPAAAGRLRPDLSIEFLDQAGDSLGFVGREAVTVHPEIPIGATPVAAREGLLTTLTFSVRDKARGVATNDVVARAAERGVPVLAQELEVQIIRQDVAQHLDDTLVQDLLQSMRDTGETALFLHVDRVRFYDPDGVVRAVWNNPTRGSGGAPPAGGGAP